MPSNEKPYPFIWAHRGASGHEVDNTIESFKLAIEMGADGLESDVHLSKEGELIFFHEDKVLWDGKKTSPQKLTLYELQSIDLGYGRKIPRVEDIFQYFKEKSNKNGDSIRYSLDIKRLHMGIPLITLAEEMGVADVVEITPNDNFPKFWNYIERFRKLSNKVQIVDSAHFNLKPLKHIFKKMYYQNWDKFKQFNLKGINVKASLVTESMIDNVKSRGLQMYVWDCHDENSLKKFMAKNIDALYSNYPDMAYDIRKNGS